VRPAQPPDLRKIIQSLRSTLNKLLKSSVHTTRRGGKVVIPFAKRGLSRTLASCANRTQRLLRSPGRYQFQAAIAAVHASAPCWEETDWLQIATLYDVLASRDRSPVVALNRAVAHAKLGRVDEAWADVDALAPALSGYHLWHATRAELLRELGREKEAAAADTAALALTDNPGERRLLQTRLRRYRLIDGS